MVSNLLNNFYLIASSLIGSQPATLPGGAIDPKTINTRIRVSIRVSLTLIVVVCVFFIIQGGFNYVNSGGSPDKAKIAQQTITNALIGLIVAFSSYAILSVVLYAIGVSDTTFSL